MLPPDLVNAFWDSVRLELENSARLDDRQAEEAIANYRDELLSKDVDELVYHREPEEVAAAVKGLVLSVALSELKQAGMSVSVEAVGEKIIYNISGTRLSEEELIQLKTNAALTAPGIQQYLNSRSSKP